MRTKWCAISIYIYMIYEFKLEMSVMYLYIIYYIQVSSGFDMREERM